MSIDYYMFRKFTSKRNAFKKVSPLPKEMNALIIGKLRKMCLEDASLCAFANERWVSSNGTTYLVDRNDGMCSTLEMVVSHIDDEEWQRREELSNDPEFRRAQKSLI